MTAEKMKKHKLISAITAVSVSAAILLTGTFAWQSISQMALNEAQDMVNPGGRLHDDFDGRNKDVYVENFMSEEEGGVPIYARVRLDEYMEIGEGAGLKTGDEGVEGKTAASLVGGANINDVTTWKTHIPGDTIEGGAEDDPFHAYWEWTTGGQTVYMPTFNKNKDSLKADINGTYDGTDPDDDVHYDDYHAYTPGEQVTDDEIYDADDDTDDEASPIEGTDIITVADQQHNAKGTLTATVMTMQEWLDAGAQPGPYWVYDTDGWAYWAQAIEPGTATGLLLDGIQLVTEPEDNWYYGINVVGQFATMGDWGTAEGSDGFFGENDGPAPTDNAIFLLNQAAGYKMKVTVSAADSATTVEPNATLQFSAEVTMGTAKHANQKVNWSVSGKQSADTNISSDGKLTVGADEYIGGTLTMQALSAVDGATIGTYKVTVESPWDMSGVGNITPGSLQTATIDGIDWYVLARDGNKALLLSKDVLETREFDTDSTQWQGSDMQTYLNGEWLTSKSTLSAHAVETAITTRPAYNSDNEAFDTTNDKVFLLSEADIFGTIQFGKKAVAKDYTLGTEGIIVPEEIRIAAFNGTPEIYWLRSPSHSENLITTIGDNGMLYSYRNHSWGIRPAMWIDLAQ